MADGMEGFSRALVELPQVRILRLEPGDMLLINVAGRITDKDFDELSTRMKAAFPDHKIVLFEDGMTLDILRKQQGGDQ